MFIPHYTRPAYVNDDFEWLCINKFYTFDSLSAWTVDFNVEPSEKAEDAEGNVEELEECSMAQSTTACVIMKYETIWVMWWMCHHPHVSLWIYMTKKVGKKWHFLGYFHVA